MNGLSLFCSAGIAETYFEENGIDIVVASELIKKRCDIHSWLYKKCHTICGSITDKDIFEQVKKEAQEKDCKFLLATPPCQGMSTLGKKDYDRDKRNYLVFYALDMIDALDFDYILIENVPKFLKLYFPYNGDLYKLIDIVSYKYSDKYNVDSFVLNAKDYGVPQSRPRGFIRIWKKGLLWSAPEPQPEITVREAIGHLPSLEAGEDSGIKWHYAKTHNERDIDAMRHTPEGKSALTNEIHYPKKADGSRMKGFHNTFKRIKWDEPCPARAMQSGNMGGHNNCHPGRQLADGTYSDARVLTLRELFIVSSLPADWNLPEGKQYTDNFFRQIVGEAIPPRFSEAIIKGIGKGNSEMHHTQKKNMISLERSMTHKWIIDKNVNSKVILSAFAQIVSQAQRGFSYEEIVNQTITQGRDANGSTITIGVRLLQLCFYMFGYSSNLEDGRKTFMPSPMTLNLFASTNPNEDAKNYLVNLFCMQYPHPFDWTPECFKLYFGRLIIKLLLDERLLCKLYIDECLWFLPFLETIDSERYEELVCSILEYRNLTYEEKNELFRSVEDYENLFANVAHEINYYFIRLFVDFGVFETISDPNHNDGNLFKFLHGASENYRTYRNDAYQSHKKNSGYIRLTSTVKESARQLINTFSPFETPSMVDGVEIFSKEDWLTNLYQTEPLRYLSCIGATTERNSEIMSIVNEMIRTSKYGSKDGKEFENALKPFIELFNETLNVEILSGPGNTDLLCTMEKLPEDTQYNMNVEAKTRNTALSSVNPARLNTHIRKYGSRFCLIVAPRFATGVRRDILGNQIVALRSEEFGNYCFKECENSANGMADFSPILSIIESNMGTDITGKVRQLTEAKYGFALK